MYLILEYRTQRIYYKTCRLLRSVNEVIFKIIIAIDKDIIFFLNLTESFFYFIMSLTFRKKNFVLNYKAINVFNLYFRYLVLNYAKQSTENPLIEMK